MIHTMQTDSTIANTSFDGNSCSCGTVQNCLRENESSDSLCQSNCYSDCELNTVSNCGLFTHTTFYDGNFVATINEDETACAEENTAIDTAEHELLTQHVDVEVLDH